MPSILNATTTNGLVTSADNSGSLQLQTNNGTTAVTIDTSQNVGIGTATPSSYGVRLALFNSGDIEGRVVTSGANYATWSLQNSTNRYSMQIRTDVSNAWVVRDETAGANRMVIDSSGNVVVGGTAAPNSQANRGNLTINGSSDAVINLTNGNSTAEGAYMYFSGTNFELRSGRASSTVRVIAQTNGVVLNNGATSWSAISDERTKDIIEPITDGLNKVASIRPVIGKYKTDEEGTRRSFLIAQDVQAVLPEAVVAQNDEIGTLTLSYTDTIPLLVKAIQELKAELDATKAEVQALKGVA